MKKRIAALILALIMIISAVPMNAMAALIDNSPEYNQEILEQLTELLGSEASAREYMEFLKSYGLLDENGNAVTSWDIEMDGKKITADELREILKGDYDKSKYVWVDGRPITLENVATIIAIEDYINELEAYTAADGELTAEQQKALDSLKLQISENGLHLLRAQNAELLGGYSGVNHGSVVGYSVNCKNGTATVTFTLSGAAEGQKVSFDYRTVSGSAKVTDEKKQVELVANEYGSAEKSVDISYTASADDLIYSSLSTTFYIIADNIKNALFSETGSEYLTIPVLAENTIGSGTSISGDLIDFIEIAENGLLSGTRVYAHALTADEKAIINSGAVGDILLNASEAFYDKQFPDGTDFSLAVFLTGKTGNFGTLEPEGEYEGFQKILYGSYEYPADNSILAYIEDFFTAEKPVNTIVLVTKTSNHYSGDFSGDTVSGIIHYELLPPVEPKPTDFIIPSGTYHAGRIVPITVEYSAPTYVAGTFITVNGTRLTPQPAGNNKSESNYVSYLYTVKSDDTTKLKITDCGARGAMEAETTVNYTAEDVLLECYSSKDAITGIECTADDSVPSEPVVKVRVPISSDEDAAQILLDDFDENGVSKTFSVGISGVEERVPLRLESDYVTGGAMVASASVKPSGEDQNITAELYCGDDLIIGALNRCTLPAISLITEADVMASVVIKNSQGGVYDYEDKDDPVVFVQDAPQIKASFSLADGKTFVFGDTEKVGVREPGKPDPEGVDFLWESSDPSVAVIAADGTVSPLGKEGEVYFSLTALNGGTVGKAVTVKTDSVKFGVGKTPFLIIPNKNITVVSGNNASVYWSSNILDKKINAQYSVEVSHAGKAVYTTTSKTGGAVIPASVLAYDYTGTADNKYTVKVSIKYLTKFYSDTAVITVESKPANITLDPLSTNYLLDTAGKVHLAWKIENFDLWSDASSELFRLLVTKGDETVYDNSTEPGTTAGNGVYTGSCDVAIADVKANKADPSSYRDVYTVTIQAKNGTDSTWSYESFIFYVYDNDALKLWINGEETGDSYKFSNISRISAMTQDEIIELKRDINLKAVISANYGDYAWAEFSDKLVWKTSDPGTASINYEQAGVYDYMESYPFVSYRPTTEFILAGEKNGTATINVTHEHSGMSTSLAVNVETLKDKLYLFKLFPSTETTLVYTNGSGTEKTVKSDANGEAAIYEESGIVSDVYCTSEYYDNIYCGYIENGALKTGEGSVRELELYPCNNLVLREAALGYVYIKNPDGTPYTGDVDFRGGVFVNGKYCETALFGFGEGKTASHSGEEDNKVSLGENGKLTVVMDVSQWKINGNYIKNSDEVDYKFLITKHGDESCYPLYVEIDATLNESEFVRTGSAIVTFKANSAKTKNPYVASLSETIYNYESDFKEETDLYYHSGCIGISDFVDKLDINVDVIWWSDSEKESSGIVSLLTENKGVLSVDSVKTDYKKYPFMDYTVTEYRTSVTKDNIDQVIGVRERTKLNVELYLDDGSLLKKETLGCVLVNLKGVMAENEGNVVELLSNADNFIATDPKAGDLHTGDEIVDYIIKNVIDDEYTDKNSGVFSLSLIPTKDPTIIIGHLTAGLASMTDTNATGIYADGTSDSKPLYYPGFRELQLLFTKNGERYLNKYADDFRKAYKSMCLIDPEYIVRGYIQVLFRCSMQGWESYVLEGGFNIGGGVSAKWLINEMLGPVPITAELKIGGTVEVSMKALTAEYINLTKGVQESDTEFLTNLRIFIYGKLFSGLGFDYSIAALKIGLFGQINFDFNFDWLNRPYLEDHDGDKVVLGASPDTEIKDKNLDGRKISIYGQAGIEFFLKVWIFSYEKIIKSWPFNILDKPYGDWKEIDSLWAKNQENFRKDMNDLLESGSISPAIVAGESVYTVNLAPTLDSFAYLNYNDARDWNKKTLRKSILPFLNAESGEADVLQTNSYPFASPLLSDDGNLLVYLSESENENGMASRISYAKRTGSGFTDMGVISNEGLGDASHSVAGTENFAVSAWTRVTQGIEKDEGSAITPEEQMIMLDSSEVYASVFNGESWSTVKLTENDSADIAPVAAVNGDKAIVAWRNVSTSNVGGNIGDFNEKDTILCRTYSNGVWSEPMSIYNGTSGNIKGITAAMLSNGTSAVTYVLDTDSSDSTTNDREIVYSIVTPDSQVYRTIRVTDDEALDENPQITTAVFDGKNEEERFVLGWSSCTVNENDNSEHELKLVDFGADGIITGTMPQALSKATSGLDITSDFRFSKNAGNIENLSIVWKESKTEESDSDDVESLPIQKSVLNAVKFYVKNSNAYTLGITGSLPVTEMESGTSIDCFDVVANDSTEAGVEAVILGTTYYEDDMIEKEAETVSGDIVSLEVMRSQTDIYTVRTEYENGIKVDSVYTDVDALKCGSDITVFFSVVNTGISEITDASVEIGGKKTEFTGLSLLPGERMNLAADYTTPDDTLEDPEYEVKATAGDDTVSFEGKAHFAVHDLEIISAEIVEENEGKRTIFVKLNNNSDAKLAGSGNRVELRYYSDPEFKNELSDIDPVVINDKDSLAMIDEGGFSIRSEFDVKNYIESASAKEIPENGIYVYIKASVIGKDEETGEETELPEAFTYNNTDYVICENLAVRSGEDVDINTGITNNDSGSEIKVSIRNNLLSEKTTGNVIVTLYDRDNNIVGQKQSYAPSSENSGLVSLAGEETKDLTFEFDEKCAYAKVLYSDLVLDDPSNSKLAQFDAADINGVSVDEFVEDTENPGTYRLSIVEETAQKTAIVVSPASPSAVITLNGEELGESTSLDFTKGVNEFDFTVTSGDGTTVSHYIFTVSKPDLIRKEAIDAAKQAIDEAVNGDTAENVAAAADYAKEAIEAAETLEDIENAKNDGIAAVNAAKELNSLKNDAAAELLEEKVEAKAQESKDIADKAIEDIQNAETKDEVTAAKEKALKDIEAAEKKLADAKRAAISELAEKAGDEPSSKAANILNEARSLINKADSVEKVNELLEQYSEKLGHQQKEDGFTMPDIYHELGYRDSVSLIADSTTDKIVFTSSDESVAAVDENGVVKSVGKGKCVITATLEGTDITKQCEIEVSYTFFDILLWVVRHIIGKIILPFKMIFGAIK